MKSRAADGRTSVTFRVPAAFDLEAHFHGRDLDYAAYFLDILHRYVVTRGANGWGFARLRRKILAKYIPDRRLTRIIVTLEKLGVIEVDRSYQVGVWSKGYRLNPPYVESREVVCRTNRLAARIRAYAAERERSLLPVHRWLRSQFRRLRFDHKRAEAIIEQMVPKAGSKITVDEHRSLMLEICQRFRRAKRGSVHVDWYGRIHTKLTNLPSAFRTCLTVDGQQLVGIDLTSSQPLICGIVAKRFVESADARYRMATRNFEERTTPYVTQEIEDMKRQASAHGNTMVTAHGYANQLASTIGTSHQQANNPLSIMCCISSESASKEVGFGLSQVRTLPADLASYLRLCEEGRLYEYLMKPGDDRAKFKTHMFADVYYGKPSYPSELRDRFEHEFPTVAVMLQQLKRHNYRHPSRLMQCYEATLFIAIICRRLMIEHPDVPIFTIHDSILTVPAAFEQVRGVILQEFGKIGICPHLKEERYG